VDQVRSALRFKLATRRVPPRLTKGPSQLTVDVLQREHKGVHFAGEVCARLTTMLPTVYTLTISESAPGNLPHFVECIVVAPLCDIWTMPITVYK
jgi:hypothetical protein